MSLAVLSPYHLTTREPPAMAALCIADEVATFLPTLAERTDREEAERAAREEPAYLDMIDSWRWSMPLWQTGLLTMGEEGASPDAQIRTVSEQIRSQERYAPLRPLMPAAALDEDRVMRNVARDVLRGGPDPAICVPVSAGLDRFAVARGGYTMRSSASSVAQRAEAKLSRRLFNFAIPILVQASAERISLLRESLAEPRAALAEALDLACRSLASGDEIAPGEHWRTISAVWTEQFEASRRELRRPCEDEDDLHVIEAVLSIQAVALPVDAVLRSSMAALKALSHPRAAVSDREPAVATLPALRDPLEGAEVLSLICRVVGRG